jgi:hypothetical protein
MAAGSAALRGQIFDVRKHRLAPAAASIRRKARMSGMSINQPSSRVGSSPRAVASALSVRAF